MIEPVNRVKVFTPQNQDRTVQLQKKDIDNSETSAFISFAEAIKLTSRPNSSRDQDTFISHENNNI